MNVALTCPHSARIGRRGIVIDGRPKRQLSGFTLVEIAIVLLCVSLLLIGLLGPLRTQLEARDRQRAAEDLREIKEAIIGYAVAEGRLPCPDCAGAPCAGGTPNDGIEDPPNPQPNGTQCAVREGNVPWATLSVPMDDPWRTSAANRSPYRYRVTAAFADYGAAGGSGDPLSACQIGPLRSSFNLCDVGDIVVNDRGGNAIATQIPALVLTYGPNKNDPNLQIGGTASAAEAENIPNVPENSIFVADQYSREDAQEFDDIVDWIPLNVLFNRMIEAGFLP